MDSQDLRLTRGTDGTRPPPLINQLPGSLTPAPACAVHTPRTQQEFDSLAIHLPSSFLVYVAHQVPTHHIQELGTVHEATRVACVVLDSSLMPQIEFGFAKRGPFFAKMYKRQLLRFLDREPTFANLCSFAKSDRQRRAISLVA